MIELNNDNFNEVINTGITIVDFYAVWCGPCRMQSPILEEVEEHYNDNKNVKVTKLNVDEVEEIAIKYGVMNIPTIIIFKNGEIAQKYIGLTAEDEIIEKIDSIIE